MAAAPVSPELLSLAAAHGLSPSVWQSWSPGLVRTPRVLVPIELEVLMVRDTAQPWADCKMATPPPGGEADGVAPTDAASLLPPPFAELDGPRPVGAYLQWYLPKGLTSGTADDASNAANFPPIPDRWLVLRISAGTTRFRRAVTGWVLEAGVEPPVVRALADWSEPGPATGMQNPLTALGHGDLSWAGYFDNVENRLGFYDGTLTDKGPQGPIAYLVCGWYADSTADPLGGAKVASLAAFNAAMTALGWQLDAGQLNEVVVKRRAFLDVATRLGLEMETLSAAAEYTTTGNWWPSATVFHGAVVNIDWPGSRDTTEVGGPPDPSAIVLAAGDTMAEALASLIARANAAPAQAPIVEALQLGVLAELDQPDGRAQLDAQLHATSFAAQSGGDAGSEPVTIAPSGPPPAPPADPGTPMPGIFARQSGGGGLVRGVQGVVVEGGSVRAAARQPGQLTVLDGRPPLVMREQFVAGGLQQIIAQLGAGVTTPPTDPGGDFDALRAVPRYYTPKDPILLVQGGKRAFTHDSSVKTENGMVICRLTPVAEVTWTMPDRLERFLVTGADVLETNIGNGSVPIECDGLLQETVLLDTGSAAAIAATAAARTTGTFDLATATQHINVEQTAWYALRNPRIDPAPLLARSGIAGTLPQPFAIAPVARPWTPIHLDWQIEFLPSPKGEDDWTLGELDFGLNADAAIPQAGSGTSFSGRATLTGGASATLAAAVRKALDDVTRIAGSGQVPAKGIEAHYSDLAASLSSNLRILSLGAAAATAGGAGAGAAAGDGAVDPSLLNDIASALQQMDVLSCGLNGLLTKLRGGVPADGRSTAPSGVTPTPFFAVRAGFLRIVRLRLVDGFGQFVDLCGSDATHAAAGYLVSDPMSVPNRPDLLALPPRFSAPTRAWFRYMSADQPGVEADYETSPVCGFLMPNHLDGALEFFNADGGGAGLLTPDEQGLVTWQGAPGLPSTAGQDPAPALANSHAARLANALIDWGVADASQSHEPALAALLRTIDSTLWTVDPFGHQGDEHLALLVGHPICLMRGLLRLDVADPVVTPDGTLATVPVRLGNLTQWQDGLLGYFVEDDYTKLYVADAAAAGMARPVGPSLGFLQQINLVPPYYATFADDVAGNVTSETATPGASPVSHPYVDTSGLLWIRPNQTINLTLLVEPLTSVHATMGRVPRKEIGMRRGWVNAGLAAIAPTFRFGPVLVDPKQIRMPLATDLAGAWVWDYRADAVAWNEGAVTNATDDALLGADPPTGSEGWLKLVPPKQAPTS
jgi:hypothetical protein